MVYDALGNTDEVFRRIRIPVFEQTFAKFGDFSEERLFLNKIIHPNVPSFRSSQNKDYQVYPFARLKNLANKTLIGFFGHLEIDRQNRWQKFEKWKQLEAAKIIIDREIPRFKPNFLKQRGITSKDESSGVFSFYEKTIKSVANNLEALHELLI